MPVSHSTRFLDVQGYQGPALEQIAVVVLYIGPSWPLAENQSPIGCDQAILERANIADLQGDEAGGVILPANG